MILYVGKLKQEGKVIKFLNMMNRQIGTSNVERSKRHEFDELSRSVYIFAQRNSLFFKIKNWDANRFLISCESLPFRALTMQVLLDLELYHVLKNDAVSGLTLSGKINF